MNCTQCRDSLIAWHAALLTPEEHRAVRDHLSHCESCADEAAQGEQLFTLLDSQEQPSPKLLRDFQERMAREHPGVALGVSRQSTLLALFQRLWPTRPVWALSYSFSLLCVGLIGGQLLPPQSASGDPALPGAPQAEGSALICPVQYFPFNWLAPATTTA